MLGSTQDVSNAVTTDHDDDTPAPSIPPSHELSRAELNGTISISSGSLKLVPGLAGTNPDLHLKPLFRHSNRTFPRPPRHLTSPPPISHFHIHHSRLLSQCAFVSFVVACIHFIDPSLHIHKLNLLSSRHRRFSASRVHRIQLQGGSSSSRIIATRIFEDLRPHARFRNTVFRQNHDGH